MLTTTILLLAGIPMLLLSMHIIGRLLPDIWKITCSHSYFIPAHNLNAALTDVPTFPVWKQLDNSEWTNAKELEWKEWYVGHQVVFKAFVAPTSDTVHQVSIRNTAPFSVNRTYSISNRDNMTFLTIDDEFIIRQPIMRILSRLFYDHEAYLKKELQQLDAFLQQS